MNSRWKKGLAFGAAAGAVWLGAEMCGDTGEKPARPPATDTDTPDDDKPTQVGHAVRDDIDEAISSPSGQSRPRPHFVPPLPPREPLELDDPESPPENLAGHMDTAGVDKATRDMILRAIFDKAACSRTGHDVYKVCEEEIERERDAEMENSKTEWRRAIVSMEASRRILRDCATELREAEEKCMAEKRRENPEAHETEEHYFLAQGAARLAGLEEAVNNGTPIHPIELMGSLGHIQLLIMQPTTDGLIQEGERLGEILGAAGMSVNEYYDMLTRIRDDYIPSDEENDPKNDQKWNPEKEPPPPSPARMRNIVEDLLDMVSE